MSNALPFGIIPKPVDVEGPLEDMSGVWRALDEFPISEAQWRPYFDNDIRVSDDSVRFSYYKAENEMLCFVANMVNEPSGRVSVILPEKAQCVTDAITGEVIAADIRELSIELGGFDYRIVRIRL